MSVANTKTHFGSVAKVFHWTIALAILANIPLGIVANDLPFGTSDELALKATLFSVHKTLGVLILFVALLRIAWAISQPHPAPLNDGKTIEQLLAKTVHWLLYGSLVLVPLTGWIAHAATQGFAPIFWPFGQSIPFVPKNEGLVHMASALHIIFERVLLLSVGLHVVGALKHHFFDKDATLRRMLPGRPIIDALEEPKSSFVPMVLAIAINVVALMVGAGLGLFSVHAPATEGVSLEAVESDWIVESGTIALLVTELGNTTGGEFADWTAAIAFSPVGVEGVHGSVDVTVAISSLTLGSVTGVAIGTEFFDAIKFPEGQYQGQILAEGDGYVVDGTLTIKQIGVPVRLPFVLEIDGDRAVMQGKTSVNRLDFGVGETYTDPDQVGFDVQLLINLTANRRTP